jgi:hypothetical protein
MSSHAIPSPSPKPQAESYRQYERLLKGEIKPAQYVASLKKEARLSVRASRDRRRWARAA